MVSTGIKLNKAPIIHLPNINKKKPIPMCSTCPHKLAISSSTNNMLEVLEVTWRKVLTDLLRIDFHNRMSINQLKSYFREILDMIGMSNLFTLRKALTENINNVYLKKGLKLSQASHLNSKKNLAPLKSFHHAGTLRGQSTFKRMGLDERGIQTSMAIRNGSPGSMDKALKFSNGDRRRKQKLVLKMVIPEKIGYDDVVLKKET